MAGSRPLAVRLLEQKGIAHEVYAFDETIRSAQEVARVTGMPPEQVLKTLVVEHDPPRGKPYLVMVPSSLEIDMKVLAASLGAKKLRMASHRDAERQTGLRVGGISALALIGRGFEVFVEESATLFEEVLVSAGQRGYDVRLALADLIALTGAAAVRAI
ncbi:MAG: aminoacyl-tRNA deacylase [Dehalococcoidia bacterium]|uniref:YbaK/EbsC family protein n=1 Tax=Candidatus Amarobacter glycogenicus TaxID=3140699 RepID=UPI001D68F076|nr:aminoacyl-tRNA deacylase [Dehalococcoidia bacterium]MBK6560878.1 aminoacyl-tRNA deacylase [Dehalococcoidia bacterium]MBK7125547.1 aminoacyl-tRNA deacylase [Dehalococcoidia bacterium]MBK7330552.1 aminoacyl-tRNA deacylase [Dehalococcoidia bacterium]MBK7726917.1 aminoacyl-tRNA deacylase [Dehalococcoidia bacterium]